MYVPVAVQQIDDVGMERDAGFALPGIDGGGVLAHLCSEGVPSTALGFAEANHGNFCPQCMCVCGIYTKKPDLCGEIADSIAPSLAGAKTEPSCLQCMCRLANMMLTTSHGQGCCGGDT